MHKLYLFDFMVLEHFYFSEREKKKLVVEFFAFRNSPRLLEIAKRIMGVVFFLSL